MENSLAIGDGLLAQESIDQTRSLQSLPRILTKLPFYLRREENALNYEDIIYAQAEEWLNQELEFCNYIPERIFNVGHSTTQELKVENIPKDAVAYLEVIPNGHLEKIYFLKKVNLLEENQPVH